MRKKVFLFILLLIFWVGNFTFAFADESDSKSEEEKVLERLQNEVIAQSKGNVSDPQSAQGLYREMKAIGLQDVRLEEFPAGSREFCSAAFEAFLPNGEKRVIDSFPCSYLPVADQTLEGELIYVGKGLAADYEDKDVKDKIVLVEFDRDNNVWIDLTLWQAEKRGARGIVFAYRGADSKHNKALMKSFRPLFANKIPMVNIEGKNADILTQLSAKQNILIRVFRTSTIDDKEKCYAVTGKVFGRFSEQYIIIRGSYKSSCSDDDSSAEAVLAIARALIGSGYQPRHTLVFILDGAGDKCGNAHFPLYSEYRGKALACIDLEVTATGTCEYKIEAAPELKNVAAKYIRTFDFPKGLWPKGIVLNLASGTCADDFAFASVGIPFLNICSDRNLMSGGINFNLRTYGLLVMAFDRLLISPLHLGIQIERLEKSLDLDNFAAYGHNAAVLKAQAHQCKEVADRYYKAVAEANHIYEQLKKCEAAGLPIDSYSVKMIEKLLLAENENILSVYRLLYNGLIKTDIFNYAFFGHEQPLLNLAGLRSAIDALKAKDSAAALENLASVDHTSIAAIFDKEVFALLTNDCINYPVLDGEGSKGIPVLDTYDVYHRILDKQKSANRDFSEEISTLEKMYQLQAALLEQALEEEIAILMEVKNKIVFARLEEAITLGEKTLENVYDSVPNDYKYVDLPKEHWAYRPVMEMIVAGVVDKGNGSKFDSDSYAARGEVAKWLAKALKLSISSQKPFIFTDVSSDNPNYNYIQAVAAAGLVKGMSDGSYRPDEYVSRAQLASIFVRALNLSTTKDGLGKTSMYTDVFSDAWYFKDVHAATKAGILRGIGDGRFAPERPVTKAEAFTGIANMLDMY